MASRRRLRVSLKVDPCEVCTKLVDNSRQYIWQQLGISPTNPATPKQLERILCDLCEFMVSHGPDSPMFKTKEEGIKSNMGKFYHTISPKRMVKQSTFTYVTDTVVKLVDPISMLHRDYCVFYTGALTLDILRFCDFLLRKLYTNFHGVKMLMMMNKHDTIPGLCRIFDISRRIHYDPDSLIKAEIWPVVQVEMEKLETMTLYDWHMMVKTNRIDLLERELCLQLLILQLVTTAVSMNRNGFFHLDLHPKNVMVQMNNRAVELSDRETLINKRVLFLEYVDGAVIKHRMVRTVVVDIDTGVYCDEKRLFPIDIPIIFQKMSLLFEQVGDKRKKGEENENELDLFRQLVNDLSKMVDDTLFAPIPIYQFNPRRYAQSTSYYTAVDKYLVGLRHRMLRQGISTVRFLFD